MAMVERKTPGERILNGTNIALLILLTIIFLYPMWHCLMASFSDPSSLIGYRGFLLKPIGFSLDGYRVVLNNPNIPIGYGNTLFYAGVGTMINILLTAVGGFCLSRTNMMLKKPLTMMLVFTMYVDFGLIPNFLNISDLGLYNSRWAIVLIGAINTYNLIVMRTAFQALPPSLEESAVLDGANTFTVLFRILIPLTKATIAVLTLFYMVGHWNSWYNEMIFLQDRGKYPLQLYLREILIANSNLTNNMPVSRLDQTQHLDELIKYCTIIVSTVPILVVYPFAQKYFVTGVMIGSVKG